LSAAAPGTSHDDPLRCVVPWRSVEDSASSAAAAAPSSRSRGVVVVLLLVGKRGKRRGVRRFFSGLGEGCGRSEPSAADAMLNFAWWLLPCCER
jgi:hypothetical protein